MSARVLNPVMMTDMSRNLGGGRTVPSRAALARVRRDLFGPVDHAAARALAERELRAQSILDAERWGFDFHLEIPRPNSRYEWEVVTSRDVVPEPYALRGMPYLRKHAPGTPRKQQQQNRLLDEGSPVGVGVAVGVAVPVPVAVAAAAAAAVPGAVAVPVPVQVPGSGATGTPASRISRKEVVTTTPVLIMNGKKTERTPPQEPRVPEIGEITATDIFDFEAEKKVYVVEPTTPVLSATTARKQSSITDFMKSRKRSLNGSTKGVIEPPEKMSRNAGQIRS